LSKQHKELHHPYLLDTEPLYADAAQVVINKYGNGKEYGWDVRSNVIGKAEIKGGEIIVNAYSITLSPEQYLEKRNEVLKDLFPTAKDMPGARDLTSHFKWGCKLPIAVATSSHKSSLELKLTLHKEWFQKDISLIIPGDDPRVKNGKPAPDIYLIAAKELGVMPSECIVFEDAISGVQAAKAAGMTVVAVPDPNLSRTEFQKISDLVIDSLDKFPFEEFGFSSP